jgi:hypothetical protein
MTIKPEALLLDTHAWIWLVRGEDRIPKNILELMFAAAGARTRLEWLALVTHDRAILDYAAKGHLRALPC